MWDDTDRKYTQGIILGTPLLTTARIALFYLSLHLIIIIRLAPRSNSQRCDIIIDIIIASLQHRYPRLHHFTALGTG